MSKVQDVLDNFRARAKPAAAFAEKLRVPEQHEQADSKLPNDDSAVRKWIIARNAANSTASRCSSRSDDITPARTLLQALQHSNRTVCHPSVRLQIMAEYERPFSRAIKSLDSRYLYQDFPLTTAAESTFQLAVTLFQEMAFGYKIAVVDSLARQPKSNKSGNKRKLTKSSRKLAINQAFTHLSHLALRHSQINRDWPGGFWKDINALAGIAALDRPLEITAVDNIKDAKLGEQYLTTSALYARLCALHIIDQKQYTAEAMRALFLNLTIHAGEVDFHTRPAQNSPGNYSVGADGPPVLHRFRLKKAGSKLHYFSLDKLIARIESENNATLVSSTTLHAKRRESRASRAELITTGIGLEEIHKQLKTTPPIENVESQFTDLNFLLSENKSSAEHTFRQSKNLHANEVSEDGTLFQVENESLNGLGLKWTGEGLCKVKVGELVAHPTQSKDKQFSWHLSIVRWLSTCDDGTLRIGTESVSRHTKPIDVMRWNKPRQLPDTVTEGLLVNYQPIDSKAAMLVLPMQDFKAGETVGYRDDTGFHMVKLIENIKLTSRYQCFATMVIKQEFAQVTQPATVDHHQLAV